MSNRREHFRSRWATSHRLIASLLLSVLPASLLGAQTGGTGNAQMPLPVVRKLARPAVDTQSVTASSVTEVPFFGPKKFVRTTGPKDVYTLTIDVPSWLQSPFRLHVQNGEPDGTFRVSSATVAINGTEILKQSDFKQNAAAYDRTVTLSAHTTLVVTLTSKPTSYLTFWLYGAPADHTLPVLTWVRPPNGATISTATPQLVVQYDDLAGLGEVAASGVDLASLRVFIDEADRSALFTRRSDEASADLPAASPLTAGLHTFKASIADLAGNGREITGEFRVDLTPPAIAFTAPGAGAYLATRTPGVSLSYSDDVALAPESLLVEVDGLALAGSHVTAGPSSATIDAGILDEGPHQVTSTIRDAGGNPATASIAFNVDVTNPLIVIAQPPANARIGSQDVSVTLTWSDAQGVVAGTATATIDGNAVALTANDDGATVELLALANSSHTFAASVADRAGNRGTASVPFIVDTTVPSIQVVAPPAGANIKTTTPAMAIEYSDDQGVVTDSLKVTINTVDQTALFARTPTAATATLVTPLPEGITTVAAEILDLTNNTGRITSTFRVDTIGPTGTIVAPAARVRTATPLVNAEYADGGSGIDSSSVALTVDGALIADVLSPGPDSAAGTLVTPLVDGPHTLQVDFSDRAGNPASLSTAFVVDTVAPQLAIAVPAMNTFVNTSTPPFRITYDDPNGTGVDTSTLRLTLRRGSEDAIDVTSYVTITVNEATGLVPATAPLTDGTYHLRAVVVDGAGNESTAETSFEVDTLAPVVEVVSPAANGYVASSTPQFSIVWSDALSGVATASVLVFIDEVDRTERFTLTSAGATGRLEAAEALAEGAHAIRVVAFDRATNAAAVVQQTFTVDTIVPTVAIDAPASGGYVGPAPYVVTIHHADTGGSGIAPAWVVVTLDGTDRTAEFTVTSDTTTASIATALTDGAHTLNVSVLDWAGNAASATSTFTVDAIKPVVQVTSPAAGSWHSGGSLQVAGTVQDVSPLNLDVNGVTTMASGGSFSATIPTHEGSLLIRAMATDAAGNIGTAEVTVNVDSNPPLITVTSPLPGLVTAQSSFTLTGTVADTSTVTFLLDGAPLALSGDTFSTIVSLDSDGKKSVTLTATDQAGNSSSKTVEVTRDTAAPQIVVVSPLSGAVVGAVPVVLSGTVQDATTTTVTVDGAAATVTGDAWQVSLSDLTEGTATFSIVATDAAGNATPLSHTITVDLAAPAVTITAPASGTLTKEATTTVTGRVTDTTLATVTLAGITATLQPGANADEKLFTLTGVPLGGGDNTLTAIATDALGRTGQASTLVTRDSIAPMVTVEGPSLITRTRSSRFTAAVEENLALREVVFKIGDVVVSTQTTAPFVADVTAPATSEPGDVLVLTVIATDTATNSTTVTKELRVTSDGAVSGLVLSNSTGLPLQGAIVRVAGQPRQTLTDDRGRYALPANDQNLVLLFDPPANAAEPMTSVERTVAIQTAVGTIPVDARLTPRGAGTLVSPSGQTLSVASSASNVQVTIPGGTVTAPTKIHLTLLGAQGLPNLLPLGWRPAVAFELYPGGELAANGPYAVTMGGTPDATLHLVRYDITTHAWVTVTPSLARSGAGVVQASLPVMGSYALAIADDATVPTPVAGELLAGVAMQPIPDTATSSGNVNPPTLPTTGGSAVGTLTVHSTTALPSGTVVQAEVTESFSLPAGQTASEEKRTQDLVLFRDGADLTAQFPIVPSRRFETGEILEGRVHLDILAGREAVRGKTGGAQALTLTSGDVELTVPAGSLPEDLAISATPAALSNFLPSTATAFPIAELVVDFGGMSLGTSAVLSIRAGAIPATDTVVIAKVVRVDGLPRVVVVAGTDLTGGRYVSKDLGPLAGLRNDGRYVFYRLSVPWGLVAGNVNMPSTANVAVVQIDGLPFVAVTNAQGDFATIAPTGTAHFTATVPRTSLSGETTAQVTSGSVAAANINLTAQATTAVVTPADGALHVPVSMQIEIAATAPLRTSTANTGTITLVRAGGVNVALRFVLSGTGRTLAVVPQTLLTAGQTYTLNVNGLTDIYGGAVAVAPVTFTTEPDAPPAYDTQKVVFTMPNAAGMVTVSAPPGSLPPGTRVLIVNAGNGVVVSYTVGNDGSFTGTFPCTINDRLIVTISDPKGNVVNFERSQFVATDGSGKTAIGPGGGIVEGPGGVQLRIPDGALDQGAVFRIEAFGADEFPEQPTVPGGHFGGGLRIVSEQKPTLKKEGDLVFPRPADAPAGSFYYIYRRLTGPNGEVAYETIDHAFEDGNGKVVTASYPFIGWRDSTVAWNAKADLGGVGFGLGAEVIFAMMYTWDALFPGSPIQGAIAGHVYRPVWDPGASAPRYEPVADAMVQVKDIAASEIKTIARTGTDGTFTLWDPHYTGGTVDVQARSGDAFAVGTAFEANPSNTRANNFGNLVMTYGYAAEVNLTFPATTQPLPSPDVEVNVMRLNESQNLLRTDINGVVAAETPLLIGFRFRNGVDAVIQNATVNGEEFPVRADDGGLGTGEKMKYILSTLYTPRHAGTYEVKATALDPLGGAPTEVQHTFLVVAGGGTNNAGIPDVAPDWITRKLVPKPNAVGVAVDILPQVVFTEPVVNVAAGLQFTTSSGPVAFKLAASAIDAQGQPQTINDLFLEPASTKVTAITLIPLGGLDFNTTYTLKLTSTIQDTDTGPTGPTPRNFPNRELVFKTIDPEPLGDAGEAFYSPAVAVVGDYAYVAKQTVGNGVMAVYDISDPDDLKEVGRAGLLGMPTHLSAEASSPMNDGETLVAVGSGLKYTPPGPSNAYLFDVRNPEQPKRVGVITLAESVEAGIVLRLALRKAFLYTITFPYGIQVIDVQRAMDIHRAAENDPAQRVRMGYDITVAGRGFGQDAVVNTVQVLDPDTGSRAHLIDLVAGEYLVGGSSRTLVMATGSTPFVVLDPTESSPRITRAPPTAEGLLQFGRAIALTRAGNRDLALIVGTGQANNAAGDLETGTALYIYDLLNPLVPNLIGSVIVDPSGSDVEVAGTTAVVATAGGAMTFSIADPARPRYLGTVEGVGYRIAIGQEGGYLVSSGTTSSSAAGLHVASFKPVVIIRKADPVNITISDPTGTVTTPQKVTALEELQVKIKVVPVVSGLNGTVNVQNNRFQRPDGTDAGANTFTPYPVVWTDAAKGEGYFTLPATTRYDDTDLVALASVDSDSGTLRSAPRSIKLGWVRLDLDSNNNTEIDATDREAARKGRRFGFWESDPNYDLKRIAKLKASGDKDKIADAGEEEKGLTDYFTVRITVNKLWQGAGASAVRLHLSRNSEDADWTIVKKLKGPKDYLRDQDSALQQVAEITGTGSNLNLTPECSPAELLIHPEGAGECRPTAGGFVDLPPLATGVHEYLVRCRDCLNRNTNDVDQGPAMWLELVKGGAGTRIDESLTDIRPLRQWITYASARPTTHGQFKPLSYLDVYARYAPWYEDDVREPKDENVRKWSNDMFGWNFTASRVPKGARDITAIVHGFNVTDSDMRNKFLPAWFKRLYWVGHPVHRLQGEWRKQDDADSPGCVKNCAQAIGISWPGNDTGVEPGYKTGPLADMRTSLRNKVSGLFFPDDEYLALASGPAIAKYLNEVKRETPSRRIRVVAHSLGNLAVNSALSRPELAGGQIDRYVMNEAAFPAESLADVPADNDFLSLWGERNPENYGYPSDAVWIEDWDQTMNIAHKLYLKYSLSKLKNQVENQPPLVFPDEREFYTMRWRMRRLPSGVPNHTQSGEVLPYRGQWRGMFSENKNRTRLFNTFSGSDRILTVVWRSNQVDNKPLGLGRRLLLEKLGRTILGLNGFTRNRDNQIMQSWAAAKPTEGHWDSVFGGGPQDQYWTIKRQWGELAFWFPATASAAGAIELDTPFRTKCTIDDCHTNFSEYSGYTGDPKKIESLDSAADAIWESSTQVQTHGYLAYRPFGKVYPAFDEIRKMFDPKN
ncbi:MAG: Ig-like domain-containing protein [Acidobacteriota bacterium]